MVTIREVAKAAGVSVATASRALNGLSIVTPETRRKIEEAAAALSYVPHSGARSLTRQKTDTIGVILPDLFGEFFSETIRGIDTAVQGAGKHLLLGNMHGSAEETALAIRSMRGRVDGLLVMPPNSRAKSIEISASLGMPVVMLNARPTDPATPYVTVDNYTGARLVTQHLVERGARRIVHIAGPEGNRDASERMRGYRDVVREQLGDNDPLVLPGDFREDAGRDAARELLNGDYAFDAVFAANDMMAIELMTELREAGANVGRDVLIAGFDDIPLARYVSPQLTTVHSNITRVGSIAAHKLLRLLQGEDISDDIGMVIEPTLAIRDSSGGSAA